MRNARTIRISAARHVSAVILIASALLLSGERSASADAVKPTPRATPQSHRETATEPKPTPDKSDQTSADRQQADVLALAAPSGATESDSSASAARRTAEEERHDRREESLEQSLVCLTAILAGIEVVTLCVANC